MGTDACAVLIGREFRERVQDSPTHVAAVSFCHPAIKNDSWRDPVKRIGAVLRPAPVVLALHALFKSRG